MILGLDTSAVDGNRPCDWAAVKAAGADFVILKRAQGMRGDACYARDSDAVRKAGIPLGCYVFPDTRITAAPPKAQVAKWKSVAGDVLKTDLPVSLDIESKNWAATGRTKSEVVEVLRQFVLELHDQFGAWPMIYTSFNQWHSLGLPAFAYGVKCPLWIKTAYRLVEKSPLDQIIPPTPHVGLDNHDVRHARNYYRIPDPWTRTGWAIQQHQGDAIGFPGMSKTVDVDRFNALRPGASEPFARWVQRVLGVKDDGQYGPLTTAAVKTFQSSVGLPTSGDLDVPTFARLAWSNR